MRSIVSMLRRKLGDDANDPTYIFTEPRIGYWMPQGATASGTVFHFLKASGQEYRTTNLLRPHSTGCWATMKAAYMNEYIRECLAPPGRPGQTVTQEVPRDTIDGNYPHSTGERSPSQDGLVFTC